MSYINRIWILPQSNFKQTSRSAYFVALHLNRKSAEEMQKKKKNASRHPDGDKQVHRDDTAGEQLWLFLSKQRTGNFQLITNST